MSKQRLSLFLFLLFLLHSPFVKSAEVNQKCSLDFLPSSCAETPCFLIKSFEPYTTIPSTQIKNTSFNFPCGQYRKHGAEGILFELMDDFWENDDIGKEVKCYYLGYECSWSGVFNMVVKNGGSAQVEGKERNRGLMLTFFSALLETADRRRAEAVASYPIVSDKLVTVGLKKESGEGKEWKKILEPFGKWSWAMFFGVSAWGGICGALLVHANPKKLIRATGMEGKSWVNVLEIISGIFESFGGGVGDAGASGELPTVFPMIENGLDDDEVDDESLEIDSPRRRLVRRQMRVYNLATVVFGICMAAHLYFFLVFYEAGLTRFLFLDKEFRLKTPVLEMDHKKLKALALHDASEVTKVFDFLQARNNKNLKKNKKDKPWALCQNYDECFRKLGKMKYTVVEDVVAKYRIKNGDHCQDLAIFSPDHPLFSFNSVMYHSPGVQEGFRRAIDKTLKLGRLTHKQQDVMNKWLSTTCDNKVRYVTFHVMLVVMAGISVCVLLLIAAQIFLLITAIKWKHRPEENSEEARKKLD